MRRLLGLLPALALLLSLAGCRGLTPPQHRETLCPQGYQLLSEADRLLYDEVVEALLTGEPRRYAPRDGVTPEQLTRINALAMADHPEIFWCDGYLTAGDETAVTYFEPRMRVAAEMLNEQRARVEAAADAVAQAARVYATEYDRAVFIHDFLVSQTEYSDRLGENGAYDIRGALLYQSGVCAGYAKAFQYICHRAGIECYYVTGTARGESHGWNVARLDGVYTLIDVTFDDPSVDGDGGYLSHCYFGPDPRALAGERMADGLYARLECEKNDYFTKNGLAAAELDDIFETVAASAAQSLSSGAGMFEFSVPAAERLLGSGTLTRLLRRVNQLAGQTLCRTDRYGYGMIDELDVLRIYPVAA